MNLSTDTQMLISTIRMSRQCQLPPVALQKPRWRDGTVLKEVEGVDNAQPVEVICPTSWTATKMKRRKRVKEGC